MHDKDYERAFFGDRQVDVSHFVAINRTEDTEAPTRFAFGYWTPDGVYHQGFVGYDNHLGKFGRPVFNTRPTPVFNTTAPSGDPSIKIEHRSNSFIVHCGDRYTGQLTWDEMLGQVISLTYPVAAVPGVPLYPLLTKDEHEEKNRKALEGRPGSIVKE